MPNAFIGGEYLSAKLRDMMEKLKIERTVRVGFLEGSTCGIKNDQNAPDIAFINEYGAPEANIPPRPFFRTAVSTNSAQWGSKLGGALKLNDYDSEKAMSALGLLVGEQIQLSITQTTDPPNKDWIWKKGGKGFDKPLEWSKNMKRSVSYEIVGGDGQHRANEGAG